MSRLSGNVGKFTVTEASTIASDVNEEDLYWDGPAAYVFCSDKEQLFHALVLMDSLNDHIIAPQLRRWASWKFLVRQWPHRISETLAVYAILLLGWALAYTQFPEYCAPDDVLGRMFFLFAGGQLCGYAVQAVGVPDMLGMIGWGVLFANVGLADFAGYERLEATFR